MQPGSGGGQRAQVAHHLRGHPLARKQRRHAGRVASDRLARDPADGIVDGDRFPLAEKRVPDRNDRLMVERGGELGDGRAVART